MVKHSLSRSLDRRKLHELEDYLEQQALILDYIKKAKAKAYIALSNDFLDYDPEIIHDYLGVSDRLEIITTMFENLMASFDDIQPYLMVA
ncbi:hypothetical protein [Rickettsiella grylli]|uniref:Uncharacterized protein n=1 Tax=Rickettsiella grylli TaxID=59196 RepID=A8PLK0_9COXI|nr:hypothetical protein [Rickettsiella grylli]EDP45718.1 hypothetical protein RICGR_0450 [Rickettsiella grylli]